MKKTEDRFRALLKDAIFGSLIHMESSTLCQLKCPVCIQNNGEPNSLGKGYLKFKDFKKFIDENHHIKNVELSNYGEMFLNPELPEIIKYSYEKKINLQADNGVNLNTVSQKMLNCLVKYQFKLLRVSIDAASPEVYRIYRIGGDFNQVINNVKIINYLKKKYSSRFPELIWQFVIFGHNEHELIEASRMAQSLNMRFIPKFNWDFLYSPIKNKKFVRKIMGYTSWTEHDEKTERLYVEACTQFWIAPQVNWDGRLLGCCVNHWADFGNVFDAGLKKCLQSEKYTYAKKMLLGLAQPRKDMPCYHCFHYKEMRAKNQQIRLGRLLEANLTDCFKHRSAVPVA